MLIKKMNNLMEPVRRHLFLPAGIIIVFCAVATATLADEKVLKMSTTTSTQASGLLDVVLPAFEKDTGIRIKVFAKGTGAAIRDGMDGNVDVIFVHDRSREEAFVKEGYGTKRFAVMHNDFVILGPPGDPAGIRGQSDAAEALIKLARAKALFISRGDDSGTHSKEQVLWEATGLALENKTSTIAKKGEKITFNLILPKGSDRWYFSIGQGMGKTITFADEKRAYILADRGTYIKYKYGRTLPIDLEIMIQGDPALNNPYGLIPVNPTIHAHVQYSLAEEFAHWLVSAKGQSLIANYKLFKKQLFHPEALK